MLSLLYCYMCVVHGSLEVHFLWRDSVFINKDYNKDKDHITQFWGSSVDQIVWQREICTVYLLSDSSISNLPRIAEICMAVLPRPSLSVFRLNPDSNTEWTFSVLHARQTCIRGELYSSYVACSRMFSVQWGRFLPGASPSLFIVNTIV